MKIFRSFLSSEKMTSGSIWTAMLADNYKGKTLFQIHRLDGRSVKDRYIAPVTNGAWLWPGADMSGWMSDDARRLCLAATSASLLQ